MLRCGGLSLTTTKRSDRGKQTSFTQGIEGAEGVDAIAQEKRATASWLMVREGQDGEQTRVGNMRSVKSGLSSFTCCEERASKGSDKGAIRSDWVDRPVVVLARLDGGRF